MRLSLVPRWEALQRAGRSGRDRVTVEPGSRRNQAEAAAETVALVLDEDSRLPESAADVEELVRRLRGHISQLGFLAAREEPILWRARQLGSQSVPDGYMPSRVYLVRLAEATQELVATVRSRGTSPVESARGRRWGKSRLNALSGTVFAVAIACLVLAASLPRP
ncbi:DUF6415 family natural product biosynthesis protein [Streptomyces sp. SCSIO 30461]|uniref:DUF6415 family natural product biosynthesis protein n=1 Tax=Streptomyces sp. SCSIO 30461 TaxID=3118085 RepID=UPI0030CCA0B2